MFVWTKHEFYDFGKVEVGLVKSFYGLSNGSW